MIYWKPMKLLDEMTKARLAWTSHALQAWYSPQDLLTQVNGALETEASWVDNEAHGRWYRDVANAGTVEDPMAWANRRLDLPDGGWVVTGIRFRNRDNDCPFVDVVATTAPATPDALSAIADTILPVYEAFHPLCMRVSVPDPDALVQQLVDDDRFGPRCAVDRYILAGLVTDLQTRPLPRHHSEVALQAAEPSSVVGRVASIYAELAEANPDSTLWATPQDEDSLQQCAEEGLLYEVLRNGTPAGVVAAIRDDAHGMRGFSVEELCLDNTHRGKGLAPALVRHLLDRLPGQPGDVLWGSIDPSNLPSLHNAFSVGRMVVAGDVWVTPLGLPGMPTTITAA